MSQHGYSPPCKMDTNGVPLEGEVTIDLLIETLTGTAFEMTVSPLDTIATIKSKIHRIEGIPVSAQHLLYNLRELDDNARLLDCSVRNGATLKLVTSMRGGPISTRRLMPSSEDRAWMDLVDANRCDNILEHLPSGQLTVLVFCEGEQLNLFRVVENVDGTYSPVTDSVNSSSMRNILSSDEPEAAAQRLHENTVTMGKVQDLQRRLSKGTRRRKPEAPGEPSSTQEAYCTSKNDQHKFMSQLTSHPTLQLTSQSKSSSPPVPSSKQSVNLPVSTSYMPGPHTKRADLLQCSLGKHLSLTSLEVSGSSSSSSSFLSSTSKSFLPSLSIPGTGNKDSAQQSRTISTSHSRQSRIPSLTPLPRSIPPPLHHAPPLPRRLPPPPRPNWNQRQRPPIIQDLKRCLPPIANNVQNKDIMRSSQSASLCLPMCQTPRKLEPIVLPNLRRTTQPTPQSSLHPHLSCGINDQLRDSSFRRITWINAATELKKFQQLSSFPRDCCLVLLRRPSTCSKERFIAQLSASLTRSFSLRFPGVLPEHLPLYLSYRLTERLSYCLSNISDNSINHLSAQLSDRICDCMEDCLSNKFPNDVLGQALCALLNFSRLHGHRFINESAGCSHSEKPLSRSMPVIQQSFNEIKVKRNLPSRDVEEDSLYCPESTRENVKETASLLARVPRFRSAPSVLSSQARNIYRSALANMQPEPLSLRLTDSSLYQRRSLSGISESSPQCPCPGSSQASGLPSSIFLNTIHSGPHSVEYVQRVIESTVQHISQPDVQRHLQGEQRQIQIMNRADHVAAPLALFPQYQESPKRIVFGSSLPSSSSNLPEKEVDLTVQHGSLNTLTVKSKPPKDKGEVSNISHLNSNSSKLTVSSLAKGYSQESMFDENQDQLSEDGLKVPKKPHRRCCQCRKKLTISNKYLCRCQKLFCSMHRYSETHDCNYNYKEEGRKLLQQENPQVMAEKIVKM